METNFLSGIPLFWDNHLDETFSYANVMQRRLQRGVRTLEMRGFEAVACVKNNKHY